MCIFYGIYFHLNNHFPSVLNKECLSKEIISKQIIL